MSFVLTRLSKGEDEAREGKVFTSVFALLLAVVSLFVLLLSMLCLTYFLFLGRGRCSPLAVVCVLLALVMLLLCYC